MLPIADTDRERLVALLRDHCVEGRITLDEFSDRVGAVYAARTADDLHPVVADLPAPLPAFAVPPTRPKRRVQRAIAVFSESVTKGRFRLDDTSMAVAVFGDVLLDLSAATIEAPVVDVTAVALFGDVTVVVPDGIEVEVEGFTVFGERTVRVGRNLVPGGPVVRLNGYCAFGTIAVRSPSELGRRARRRLR